MKLHSKTYQLVFINLLFIVLTILSITIHAQDSYSYPDEKLEENEIDDLVELSKYDKTVSKLRLKEGEVEELEIPQSRSISGIGLFFRGILYIIIGALVLFILYILFSSIKVDKKIKPEAEEVIEEVEDIEVIDAESGLDIALKAENYREAVRMLFIKLLQVLVMDNKIIWKPEKTNRDYLREMKNHPKIEHFNNLVIAYERIWYGSEPIDKLFFDFLRADFEKFYSTENINIDVKE